MCPRVFIDISPSSGIVAGGCLPPCHYMALCQRARHPDYWAALCAPSYTGVCGQTSPSFRLQPPVVAVAWRSLLFGVARLLFGVAAVEAHNLLRTGRAHCNVSVLHVCVTDVLVKAISTLYSVADCWGCGRRIAPL